MINLFKEKNNVSQKPEYKANNDLNITILKDDEVHNPSNLESINIGLVVPNRGMKEKENTNLEKMGLIPYRICHENILNCNNNGVKKLVYV